MVTSSLLLIELQQGLRGLGSLRQTSGLCPVLIVLVQPLLQQRTHPKDHLRPNHVRTVISRSGLEMR